MCYSRVLITFCGLRLICENPPCKNYPLYSTSHFTMSFQLYVHRSGRTARAEMEGLSVVLVGPEDLKAYRNICKTLNRGHFPPLTLTPSHCHPHTVTLTLLPSHYHPHTITLTLSPSHYHPHPHTHTIALILSPSHYHPHTHTIALTLSPSHYHPHTIALTLSPSHYHPHTVTLTLSPSPSHSHYRPHTVTLTLSPSHSHYRPHTIALTLSPSHYRPHTITLILTLSLSPSHHHSLTPLSLSLSDEELASFPMESSYLPAIRRRVSLARQIDSAQLLQRRARKSNDWLLRSAKAMDIEVDEDMYPLDTCYQWRLWPLYAHLVLIPAGET